MGGGYLKFPGAEQENTGGCRGRETVSVKGYCDWCGLREIFVTFLVRQPTIVLAFLATTSHRWLTGILSLQSTKIPKSFTHTALKPCFLPSCTCEINCCLGPESRALHLWLLNFILLELGHYASFRRIFYILIQIFTPFPPWLAIRPREIPYAHLKMTGSSKCPVFQSTSLFCLKGTLSYFFLTSWFAKLHLLECFCIRGRTLYHPGIYNKDIFFLLRSRKESLQGTIRGCDSVLLFATCSPSVTWGSQSASFVVTSRPITVTRFWQRIGTHDGLGQMFLKYGSGQLYPLGPDSWAPRPTDSEPLGMEKRN